jgi:hypothetical protein
MESIVSYLAIYLKFIIKHIDMVRKDNKKIIKCCSKSLEFILQEGQSWQAYTPEIATCSKCSTYYEKKEGKDFAYKKINDFEYICTVDGKVINAVKVGHPIWDGPFPMSGSGKCQYESVPYCPKHEKKPNYNGSPIQIKFEDSELYKRIMSRGS